MGTAVPERVNLYRANAARSVGGNARRMSHNPPDPILLDIYDRVGMVVMDENREFQVGEEYYHNQRDMVQRDRNHPSVVYAPAPFREKKSVLSGLTTAMRPGFGHSATSRGVAPPRATRPNRPALSSERSRKSSTALAPRSATCARTTGAAC